jgi:hypothetical protein
MIKLKDILLEDSFTKVSEDWWTDPKRTGGSLEARPKKYLKLNPAERIKNIDVVIKAIKRWWGDSVVEFLGDPNPYMWTLKWNRTSEDGKQGFQWMVDDKIIDNHLATVKKLGAEWLKTANTWKSVAKKKDYEKHIPALAKKFKELNDTSIKTFKFIDRDVRKNKKPSPAFHFEYSPRMNWLREGTGWKNDWKIKLPTNEKELTNMIGTHEQFAPTSATDRKSHDKVGGKYTSHRLKMIKKIAPKAVVAYDGYDKEKRTGYTVYDENGKDFHEWFVWTPKFGSLYA